MRMSDEEVMHAYSQYISDTQSTLSEKDLPGLDFIGPYDSPRNIRCVARSRITEDLDRERRFLVVRDPAGTTLLPHPPTKLHRTLHSALVEAERLAAKEKVRFMVFESTHRIYLDNTVIEAI